MNEQNALSVFERDPFRLFFPIGLIYGIWAISVWIIFGLGLMESYPSALHTNLILGGFEVSFVVGFLMTAIPRFTKTNCAHKYEVWMGGVLVLLPAVLVMCGAVTFIPNCSLATFAFLAVFAGRRIGMRGENPPDSFVFVGAALGLGILSQLLRVLGLFNLIDLGSVDQISRSLLHHGFILGLVIGIGSRLIPGILGWSEIVASQKARYEQSLPFYRVVSPMIWMALAGFLFSFPLESWNSLYGRLLRAFVALFIATTSWRIHRRPINRTIHAWSIWASGCFIIFGLFCYALFPSLSLESEHIIFIGGYSLLTLMVASRVALAHGEPGGLIFEKKIWPYAVVLVLFVVAMVTRFFSASVPQSYIHHLAYAAAVWIGGAIVWGLIFLPKMFR